MKHLPDTNNLYLWVDNKLYVWIPQCSRIYTKYAKNKNKKLFKQLILSRFINLDKCNKIFEIYSSTFRDDVESATEYLQMESTYNWQHNKELKHIIKTSEPKKMFITFMSQTIFFQIWEMWHKKLGVILN